MGPDAIVTYKKGNATKWSSNNLPPHLPSKLLAWVCVCVCVFSHVQLLATLWTVTCQASVSLGSSQARILDWVVISFSRESFQSRDQTHVSCIGRQILYHWATREAQLFGKSLFKSYLLKSPLNLTFLTWNVKITVLHPVDCWKCTIH